MGLPLLIENLEWRFSKGEEPFLRIPYLELRPGEAVALAGPSGAGKSTLLFLLAGLERPDRGRVLWGGENLSRMGERARDLWRRRSLGLVFQDFQLVPELTALQNVLLPVSFDHWRPAAEETLRAEALLARLGVERPDARAATLSRGEMQRVALARALLGRPPVLLADEPTASLDAENEAAVSELLLEAAREDGATLLIATHQASVKARADRVVELSHGALVSAGPAKAVRP